MVYSHERYMRNRENIMSCIKRYSVKKPEVNRRAVQKYNSTHKDRLYQKQARYSAILYIKHLFREA